MQRVSANVDQSCGSMPALGPEPLCCSFPPGQCTAFILEVVALTVTFAGLGLETERPGEEFAWETGESSVSISRRDSSLWTLVCGRVKNGGWGDPWGGSCSLQSLSSGRGEAWCLSVIRTDWPKNQRRKATEKESCYRWPGRMTSNEC